MSTDTTTTAETTAPAPSNVFEALVSVRAACPYVQKDKETQSGPRFKYASIDNYLDQLKPHLDAAGICIFPVGSEVISRDRVEVGNGERKSLLFLSVIRVRYSVAHGPSNTTLPQPVEVLGEATDNLDKSIPKAYTMALKQCMRQLFQVETGEEERERGPQPTTQAGQHPKYGPAEQALRGAKTGPQLERIWKFCEESGFSQDELRSLKQVHDKMIGKVSHDPADASANNPSRQNNGQRPRQPSN